MPMIAVGENHTIALRSDGTVWSWGNNSYGQSGNGSKSSYTTIPVQVLKRENATASPSALTNVIKIATGGNHSLALTSDGVQVLRVLLATVHKLNSMYRSTQ